MSNVRFLVAGRMMDGACVEVVDARLEPNGDLVITGVYIPCDDETVDLEETS